MLGNRLAVLVAVAWVLIGLPSFAVPALLLMVGVLLSELIGLLINGDSAG